MIRRALLITGSAIALSAAGAMAYTRGEVFHQDAEAGGGFCPAPPAGSEHPTLTPAKAEVRMSIDPGARGRVTASEIVADSLLAPAPAICRPEQEAASAQSSIRR